MGSLAYFPAMDMVRQALPMVMSFLKMAMVICIPMVLVIGTYQLKVAMTMTVVFFAMMFVDFWFQLAKYIDSTILDAFYGSGSPPCLSFNPVKPRAECSYSRCNFELRYRAMFIILPLLWITAIGWSGVYRQDKSSKAFPKAPKTSRQRVEKRQIMPSGIYSNK
ncbi:conjugal transfer protein TraG N-terminal domain-containing protein [Pseudomonas aeruginosa]|nr:conjugal transfer protein TraG N-terminal domain-containing protein [Pseudomonas aeruginosa]